MCQKWSGVWNAMSPWQYVAVWDTWEVCIGSGVFVFTVCAHVGKIKTRRGCEWQLDGRSTHPLNNAWGFLQSNLSIYQSIFELVFQQILHWIRVFFRLKWQFTQYLFLQLKFRQLTRKDMYMFNSSERYSSRGSGQTKEKSPSVY